MSMTTQSALTRLLGTLFSQGHETKHAESSDESEEPPRPLFHVERRFRSSSLESLSDSEEGPELGALKFGHLKREEPPVSHRQGRREGMVAKFDPVCPHEEVVPIKARGFIPKDEHGKLRTIQRGKPEAARIDVYFGPLDHQAEQHYGKGNIRNRIQARMALCNLHGMPLGREFGLFTECRDQLRQAGSSIGFTVFMNGINVSKDEFVSCTNAIYSKVNKRTLTIGLYNKSSGVLNDTGRLCVEKILSASTESVRTMRYFLETVTDHLYHERVSIRLRAPFLMIVHSEGGLILHRAIHGLDKRHPARALLKTHMYVITLGSVRPIPDRYGVGVINIYSKKDHVTNPFATNYDEDSDDDDNGYTIKHVCCSSKADERIGRLIDHSFLADTYQKHLGGQITALANSVGFGSEEENPW